MLHTRYPLYMLHTRYPTYNLRYVYAEYAISSVSSGSSPPSPPLHALSTLHPAACAIDKGCTRLTCTFAFGIACALPFVFALALSFAFAFVIFFCLHPMNACRESAACFPVFPPSCLLPCSRLLSLTMVCG